MEELPVANSLLTKLGLSGKAKKRDVPYDGRNRALRRQDERNERRSLTKAQKGELKAKHDRKTASRKALALHLGKVRAKTAKRHAEAKAKRMATV